MVQEDTLRIGDRWHVLLVDPIFIIVKTIFICAELGYVDVWASQCPMFNYLLRDRIPRISCISCIFWYAGCSGPWTLVSTANGIQPVSSHPHILTTTHEHTPVPAHSFSSSPFSLHQRGQWLYLSTCRFSWKVLQAGRP